MGIFHILQIGSACLFSTFLLFLLCIANRWFSTFLLLSPIGALFLRDAPVWNAKFVKQTNTTKHAHRHDLALIFLQWFGTGGLIDRVRHLFLAPLTESLSKNSSCCLLNHLLSLSDRPLPWYLLANLLHTLDFDWNRWNASFSDSVKVSLLTLQ